MTDGEIPVFVALDIGRTIDTEGRQLPTVVIDASDAPEVADLARVHAVEGIGDIRTEAIRVGEVVVFGIRMTTPVNAAFAIAIDAERHRPLLDDIVAMGSLVVAHTDPRLAEVEQPNWLAVDIDGPELAAQLR